jgi:hypothetical protein
VRFHIKQSTSKLVSIEKLSFFALIPKCSYPQYCLRWLACILLRRESNIYRSLHASSLIKDKMTDIIFSLSDPLRLRRAC